MMTTVLLVLAIGGLAISGALLSAVAHDTVAIRRRTVQTLDRIRVGTRSPATSGELSRPLFDRVGPAVVRRIAKLGLRFLPEDRPVLLQRRIAAAGSPQGWTVDRVVAAQFFGLAVGWLVGLVVSLIVTSRPPLALAISLITAAAAYLLPELILYQLAYKRSERIRADLPDVLDVLTISVEAGQPFETALRQVVQSTSGPLRSELARLIHEMDLGMARAAALRGFGERARVPEARSLAVALAQVDALGVPISNVLRTQANQLRQWHSQRIEEQAQKMPVKIIFPLILCILPALLVVVIGPAAITLLRTLGTP
jgi:tight adherence protein C